MVVCSSFCLNRFALAATALASGASAATGSIASHAFSARFTGQVARLLPAECPFFTLNVSFFAAGREITAFGSLQTEPTLDLGVRAGSQAAPDVDVESAGAVGRSCLLLRSRSANSTRL
jgi:hypothetical protein